MKISSTFEICALRKVRRGSSCEHGGVRSLTYVKVGPSYRVNEEHGRLHKKFKRFHL